MPPKKEKEEKGGKKDSEEPKLDPISFKSKDPKTLYQLLFSVEDNILWRSCDALYNYSLIAEANKQELIALDCATAAIPHLSSQDAATRRSAVMLINSLAQMDETKAILREVEVVNALIALLKPEEGVMTHEHATKCLGQIADTFSTKATILEGGGIELLVALISDPDPLVQQNVLECLISLSEDCQCRIAFNDAEVVGPLLENLKNEYPVIQTLVLQALHILCQEVDIRNSMKEVNGIDTLLKILSDEELGDLHEGVIGVVGVCMVHTDQLNSMKDSGCLLTLLGYVSSANPSGQLNALRTLATAAKSEDNARILHDNNIETTIMSVLGSENNTVLAQACFTVSTMAGVPLCKETFTKAGVVQALMKLIGSEDEEVQEMSTLSLANLSLNNSIVCLDIVHDENITKFIEVLASGTSPRTLTYMAHIVFNVVKDEKLREELAALDIIQSLASCLTNPDTDVCVASCKALAALMADSSSRTILLQTNALGSLVSLLRDSPIEEVVRKAAWTIGICVANEDMAKEVNKHGALKILMDMSATGTNNLALVALEKLLQYDLAAKYWLKGELSQIDVVCDGFYDTGAHKPAEQFYSLKHLLDKKVDQKRACLYIGTQGSEVEPIDAKSEGSTTGSTTNVNKGRSTAKGKKQHKAEEKKEEEPVEEKKEVKEDKPRLDTSFREYCDEVKATIAPLPTVEEQIKALAVYVSNQMGGPVSDVTQFSWELHISQIKSELKSNVIPIGFVKRGIFYHRSILFKALGDRIGVNSSLTRGEYNRAWNQVTLLKPTAKHYIVDLMYEPGRLIEIGSYDAGIYKKL